MSIFENKFVIAILTTLIFFYSSYITPDLPKVVKKLFNNPIFRICILFLIVYLCSYNVILAISISVFFVIVVINMCEYKNNKKINNNK
jgi:hypothetical protein